MFFQQKEGMAVGSSLSPTVSNICMEYFDKVTVDSARHNPSSWLRYVDDTCDLASCQRGYRMFSAISTVLDLPSIRSVLH
jgi:hypothetical protein